MIRLATGQQMVVSLARKGVKLTKLTKAEIRDGRNGANLDSLTGAQLDALLKDTPLWFYILREEPGFPRWRGERLHRRFDLIGMDPRGVGLSTRVRCDPAVYNRPVSLFPRTAAQFRRLANYARALGRSCRKRTGALLGHAPDATASHPPPPARRHRCPRRPVPRG